MRRAIVALGAFAAILAGLGVASPLADSVTLQTRSTVLRTGEFGVGVFGTISSGAEGEYVAVTGKECGIPGASFRAIGGATTTAGGAWETTANVNTTTTLRAEWKGANSVTVVVRARAYVRLAKQRGAFVLTVGLQVGRLDGKRVTVQRLTPSGWKPVRTVTMQSGGYGAWGEERGLRFKVPKGTPIRAVLPLSQAKPCYLAGYSNVIRT
jgi:hypothetical protein